MSNLGIAGFEQYHRYVTLPLSIEPKAERRNQWLKIEMR